MNERIFDELIRSERDRVLPECPPSLESNVLRRVRLAANDAGDANSLNWLLGLFPRREFALGALALGLLLSASASVVVTSRYALALDRQSIATSSLDFGVFRQAHVINLD